MIPDTPPEACNAAMVDALALPGQPAACFAALGRLADRLLGARLFTLMRFDAATQTARRIHSNMPDAYPIQGSKPAPVSAWAEVVLERREIFVANDADGLRAVFADHDLIARLGCAAVLNLPVVVDGQVLGTVNCLDVAGRYTPARIRAAEALRLPAVAAFLLDRLIAAPDRP